MHVKHLIICGGVAFFALNSCTNPDTNVTEITHNTAINYDIVGKWTGSDVKGKIDITIPIPGIEDKIMVALQDEVKASVLEYKADSTFTLTTKDKTVTGQYKLEGNHLQHYNINTKMDILSNSNIEVAGNKLTIAVSPDQLWEIVNKHIPGLADQAKSFVEFSTFNFIFEQQVTQ